MHNLLLNTDSYKHSHFKQYPPGAKHISSYIEARVGESPEQVTMFFGMQLFLRRYLEAPISLTDVAEAEELCAVHGVPFNHEGWMRICNVHDGFLPIEIEALPEGAIVPRGTPLVQVRNLDPEMPWLTSFIETALLRSIWYPSSVATLSMIAKTVIYEALQRTSDDPDGQLPFKLHDFGARGVSSSESAGIGGLAHLVNFQGTDTMEALTHAQAYYDADCAGFSIPASEHSTMTSWGRAHEVSAYQNMISQFGDGMFSVVADSYDLYAAVHDLFGGALKQQILDMKGTLVVRPDSGDPVTTPLAVIDMLWDAFGGTTNSKGFRVLNPKVRVIQGDGMDTYKIGNLCAALEIAGYAIDNIAFGMGGGLLQAHMRDDMRYAMKANAISFDSETWVDVQKKPATDPTKASKAGRQAVIRNADGVMVAVREADIIPDDNLMQVVYSNGIIHSVGFEEVRARADADMKAFHSRIHSDVRNQVAAE